MYGAFQKHLAGQLADLRKGGLYKSERTITTPQGPHVQVNGAAPVLNLCANNYLGLAGHPEIIKAARENAPSPAACSSAKTGISSTGRLSTQ